MDFKVHLLFIGNREPQTYPTRPDYLFQKGIEVRETWTTECPRKRRIDILSLLQTCPFFLTSLSSGFTSNPVTPLSKRGSGNIVQTRGHVSPYFWLFSPSTLRTPVRPVFLDEVPGPLSHPVSTTSSGKSRLVSCRVRGVPSL